MHPGDEPRPCRGPRGGVVVQHQPVAVADAEPLHPLAELRRGGEGCGHLAGAIHQGGEVEEAGPGNVAGGEFGAGVARRIEHMRRRVDNHQPRLAEPFRQPAGGDQIVHRGWT